MEGKMILAFALTLCISIIPGHCKYHSHSVPRVQLEEKKTHLHFFFHDTQSGRNPSAVVVARANQSDTSGGSFGTVFAIDDPLTDGPELTSNVVGNARGLYVSSSKDEIELVLYADFGFTTGEFNGSSVSVFSRNTVMHTERELAVVGGRGKFRMARGFAELKTHSVTMGGDAIVEYNMTILHF